jgi:hypothetical protein
MTKARDLSITKVCATCGKKFHPKKNGYQLIAKYCNAACAKKGRALPPGLKRG